VVRLITQSKLAWIIEENNDATPAVATQTQLAILMALTRLVTQQALTTPTINKTLCPPPAFNPTVFARHALPSLYIKFEHYANPMVHPIMGKTISSYRKLMNNPATTEVWQIAFRKDFGGMAQGDNKRGQKGTNAMFIMTHDKITHAYCEKKCFTFANPVIDYHPQKADLKHICITAMGNLITYDG
jgi:hypothetical protein